MTVRYFPNPPDGLLDNPDFRGWLREIAHELNIDEHVEVTTIDPANDELLIFKANVNTTRKIKLSKCGGTGGGGGIGTVTSVDVAVAKDDTYLTSGGPITSSGTITETAVDAGSDKLVGWDDSADKKIYFTLGTGLSTSTTTLNASVTISKDDTETPSGTTITAVDAGSDKIVFWDDSADKKVYGSLAGSLSISGTTIQDYQWIAYRLCHKDTALTTGELEIDYPPGFTFLDAYVSVDTVSSSGLPTFDIKESGTTMLSTLITVDVSENTSKTAATPPVISDSTFTAFNKLSLHCTVAGTGTKGAILHMKVLWT